MDLFLVGLFAFIMGAIVTYIETKEKCKPFHSWSNEFGTDVMVCIDCGEIVNE